MKTLMSLLSLALLAGCQSTAEHEQTAAEHQPAAAEHKAEWNYAGATGPDNWGELSPAYALCGSGRNQSPIDITGTTEAELGAIDFSYQTIPLSVINNGHTVQVNYAEGSQITVDGHTYKLLQYHFHSPSENLFDGKSYPLEAHLVHADADGNLAVIGVMFEDGAASPALASVWEHVPQETGGTAAPAGVSVNAMDLLPEDKGYYRYTGSLTTPPCSEGVRWMVMKTPVGASPEQVEQFRTAMHEHDNTNRPIQPHFARAVLR